MTVPEALANAIRHHQAGRLPEAEDLYRQILAVQPDHADALHLLGVIADHAGQHAAGVELILRAITLQPMVAAFHSNLGEAYRKLGRRDEAAAEYRRALEIDPDLPEAHSNLGNVLKDQGRPANAVAACLRALELWPDFPEAFNNLGNALRDLGRLDEAAAAYQRVIDLTPDFAEAHSNLGAVFRDQGRLDEAINACQFAIHLRPNLAEAHSNLGNALIAQGHLEQAVTAYQRAMKLKPLHAAMHSNLLLLLHYCSASDPAEIFSAHRHWDEVRARPLAQLIAPHGNDHDPERRLRIGYVSPDFREHSAAFFLEGLLTAHDPEKVEVFCYADHLKEDEFTARFRLAAAHWRKISGVSDEDVAQMIRTDGIDILVDLAGHTAGNRLLVFARKPAPVQASYLGYCDTTGLTAMDWRITDAFCDPPGSTEHLHSEKLLRLPDVFACFRPSLDSPPVQPLPALARGHVTFGSFHMPAKLNEDLLACWARILQRVPSSRLLIATTGIHESSFRGRLTKFFTAKGIASERLEFQGDQPLPGYLALHNSVDVLLDSFPFTGHTIACHALWMGVPVVTLAGKTHFARMVGSVLNALGLPELIARTPEEYVEIACGLARDTSRLAHLRSTLRERMRASPVTDAPRFARHVELAFRQMWRAWCTGHTSYSKA